MGSSAVVCSFSPSSCLDMCLCLPKFKLSVLYNSSSWLITKFQDYQEVPCMSREVAWGIHVPLGFLGCCIRRGFTYRSRKSCWQLGPSARFWSFWAILRASPFSKLLTSKGRNSITLCPLKTTWNTLKCLYWQEPLERQSKFPVLQVLTSAVCSTLDG